MVRTTKAQRKALKRKFDQLIDSYAERIKRGELARMTVLCHVSRVTFRHKEGKP